MSGAEGLVALGLACNIFQVISFGRETLDLVKGVYRDGTLDNSLMDKIAVIQNVASNIIDVNIPQSGNQEKKLVDVTKKCTGVARDLQEEIAFLVSQNGQGSLRATLKIAAKANWRKRRLDRMEKALSDAEQLMQTTLLAWIFKSANTANIDLDSLGHELRNFVIKYEHGSKQASQLVSSEALHVREVVVQQSGKTEKALRAHVTRTAARFERKFEHNIEEDRKEQRRAMLLKSLKYPGMNERANQVENAHARTFRWLFADADDSSYSGDEEPCSSISEELNDQDTCSEDDWTDVSTDDEYEEEWPPEMFWSSFTDWLQSDLGMYWIMGKPGSGKSTLAKFILCEPRTQITLEKWRPGAVVASHYFWRPGALMQRSIKGMLCSIIYQLVSSIPNALEYALTNVPGLSHKDAVTDWSVADLQQFCLGLISHCGKPLCLFIDGLDECGPEDNHQRLLDILENIKLPNVKIIVSSRNEPIFEKRFRHEPQLRMQDLTAGDMRKYVTYMLLHDVQGAILEELVEKAEGVFLWLVLAVQSINRGSSHGESLKDLRRRIKKLPKGLHDMYKDMWERLDDDCDLYRESAALYFKLKMAADGKKLKCLQHGWSILEMMLASFAKTRWSLARRPLISRDQLVEECVKFQRRVRVHCAGLLVLYGRPASFSSEEDSPDTERALLEYADTRVGFAFIHRSAQDFLVDTVEGQNILGHGGMSPEDIDICIISGMLWATGLLRPVLEKAIAGSLPQALKIYLDDVSNIADARHRDVGDLLSLCFQLYISAELMSIHWDERPTRAADFFGEAACYSNLDRYCISIIEKQLVGNDIRSAILLSVSKNIQQGIPPKLVEWLLSLPEIDVNMKCPLLVLSGGAAYYSLEDMGPLDSIKTSPFTRLLGFGLEHLHWRLMGSTNRYHGVQDRYSAMRFLQLVAAFACHGADLRSPLLIAFQPDYRFSPTGYGSLRLLQIPGKNLTSWSDFERNNDKNLCVVALQATSIIKRMLATVKGEFSPREHGLSLTDLEKAVSSLSQKCQESDCGAEDRVIGFLQRSDIFDDIPYRKVSDLDSANLMAMIWACIFEGGSRDLGTYCREVMARSPFSSVGFRDYMRDTDCFDGLAAHRLLLEYRQETRYFFVSTKTKVDGAASY